MLRLALACAEEALSEHEKPKPYSAFFPNLKGNKNAEALGLVDGRSLCSRCGGSDPDCTNVCAPYWAPRRATKAAQAFIEEPTEKNRKACGALYNSVERNSAWHWLLRAINGSNWTLAAEHSLIESSKLIGIDKALKVAVGTLTQECPTCSGPEGGDTGHEPCRGTGRVWA